MREVTRVAAGRNMISLTSPVLLFAACQTSVIGKIAAPLKSEVVAVQQQVDAAAGEQVFPWDSVGGAEVTVDDEAVEARRESTGRNVAGFFDHETNTLTMPSLKAFTRMGYPAAWYRMILAHELGHALGIIFHSDDPASLMHKDGALACVGREGACLYRALVDAGRF